MGTFAALDPPQMANVLGVSVEEVLGKPCPKRAPVDPGKLGQVFEAASKPPQRKQQKIIDIVEPFIREQQPSKA